jgi:hypothetical protein
MDDIFILGLLFLVMLCALSILALIMETVVLSLIDPDRLNASDSARVRITPGGRVPGTFSRWRFLGSWHRLFS